MIKPRKQVTQPVHPVKVCKCMFIPGTIITEPNTSVDLHLERYNPIDGRIGQYLVHPKDYSNIHEIEFIVYSWGTGQAVLYVRDKGYATISGTTPNEVVKQISENFKTLKQ